MDDTNFEKTNLFKRSANLLKFVPHASWENFFIVFLGAIFATILGEYFGILNFVIAIDGVFSDSTSLIGGVFFVIVGIVEMYLIRKIPLKLMKKNVIIYAFVVGIAFATAILAYRSLLWGFTSIFIWILVYVYLQLLDDTRSIMGLFGILIYILVIMSNFSWDPIYFPYETVVYYFIFGFLMVIINSIPMFIVRLLQKDPAKRELLSRLFDKDIEFHEFVMIKEEIVDFDNSKRNRSLISIAKEFYIANSNIQTLSKYMEDEEDYLLFLDEIERLLTKVRYAILKGYDLGFEVNIGYIVEYQKTLEYKLAAIPNKNTDQLLLDSTIKNYKRLFEDLNAILENKKNIDTIAPHKKRNNLLEVIKGFNLSNVNLRYSVRSILALILSLVFDIVFVHSSVMMTTLISAFSIKPSASNTNRNIFIRFAATIVGIVLGILISVVLKGLLLNAIVSYLVIVCFMLFFIFYEDEQLSLIFVMMAFIFLNINESVFVSIEHLIMTIISMFIIIFLTNFILPTEEDSNVIQLLIHKIELYIQFNEISLINDETADDILQEISNNDYEILRLFSNIEDTYENIVEDMKVLTELNSALSDYGTSITGVKRYSKGFDLSEFGKAVNEVLESSLARITGEADIYDKDISEELTRIVLEITDDGSEIQFLKASFINMVNDFIYISELISEGEKLSVFELYDQNILEENLSERFTVENFKYIINQYKYIFVAAKYLQDISSEDITGLAKKSFDSAQGIYDGSVKKAYGVAGESIKGTLNDVSDNLDELKHYAIGDLDELKETVNVSNIKQAIGVDNLEIADVNVEDDEDKINFNFYSAVKYEEPKSIDFNILGYTDEHVHYVYDESDFDNITFHGENEDDDLTHEERYIKNVYDIYQDSDKHMKEIQKEDKINKIYIPNGGVIEITDEQHKELLKNTKENRKFFNRFVKTAVKSSWKDMSKREFKTTLDKDKALKNRKRAKNLEKTLNINFFNY